MQLINSFSLLEKAQYLAFLMGVLAIELYFQVDSYPFGITCLNVGITTLLAVIILALPNLVREAYCHVSRYKYALNGLTLLVAVYYLYFTLDATLIEDPSEVHKGPIAGCITQIWHIIAKH